MKDLNKIMLLGRLGVDPVLRHTKNNTAVTQLSVATSRRFRSLASPKNFDEKPDEKSGEQSQWEEETQWHRVVVWGHQAETCSKYLKKGSKVFIEGCVRSRNYEDSKGVSRTVYEVHSENISFLNDNPSLPKDTPAEVSSFTTVSPFELPDITL